jgi:antitoxin component YwqK of YwqJK toxin-antitoxin module
MKKILYCLLLFVLVLTSCSEEVKKNSNPLIEMKDGVETIWYPGKKQVKYRREYDSQKKRHGKWLLYNPEGKVMSSSFYDHGKKTGVWLVNYQNGQLRYTGEYKNDERFGEWIFYSITGNKQISLTYGEEGKLVKKEIFKNDENQKENDSISKSTNNSSKSTKK